MYLSQVQDARVFIQKLLQIKLVEHRIEVKVTVLRGSKSDEAGEWLALFSRLILMENETIWFMDLTAESTRQLFIS